MRVLLSYDNAWVRWAAPESGTVWIEAWDATYSLPYYVNCSTGESQWEWPAQHEHIVQHDSEDYHWYWAWLNGEGSHDGGHVTASTDDAEVATAGPSSRRNLFGSD